MRKDKKGFTLVELLVVIAILGLLGSIILVSLQGVRKKAYLVRAKKEMLTMVEAIEMYALENNYQYPADADRDMPSGLEDYLSSDPCWPDAPWPESFYDWDYWDSDSDNPNAGTLSYPPEGEVYQVSIRFCSYGSPGSCNFPDEDWADDFDYYSSVYWCISGHCRAHGSKPFDHPGCCMGNCPSEARLCE